MGWLVTGTLILLAAVAILYLGVKGLIKRNSPPNSAQRNFEKSSFRIVDFISRLALGVCAVIYLAYIFFKNKGI